MLRPTKHTNLRSSTINVGAAVLHVIRVQGRASMADIESVVRERCGEVGARRIQAAILLLYTLGALNYVQEFDAFVASATKREAA